MSDNKLRETLEKAFPDTPEIFHERMQMIANQQKQERRAPRRVFGTVRFAIVCLMVLSFCATAVALMDHYGVLNFDSGFGPEYYYTLPQAQDMIQYDLAAVTTGNLEWRVKEAIYDGRVLRVLYAVKDTTASEPYAMPEGEDRAYEAGVAFGYYGELCEREGVYLKADGNGEIIVNGLGVNLESTSARLGAENGEIEFWVDCRMQYYDFDLGEYTAIQPEGELAMSLPFGFHREKTDADADALSWALQAGDAATRYAVALPEHATLPTGATLAFTDLHFSPVQVFITLEVSIPAENAADIPQDEKSMEFWDAVSLLEEYQAIYGNTLVNSLDEELGLNKDGYTRAHWSQDGSCLILEKHMEFTPSDRYTDTIYLVMNDWKIPIPLK